MGAVSTKSDKSERDPTSGVVFGAKVGLALGISLLAIAAATNTALDWPLMHFFGRQQIVLVHGTEAWIVLLNDALLGIPLMIVTASAGAGAGALCTKVVGILRRLAAPPSAPDSNRQLDHLLDAKPAVDAPAAGGVVSSDQGEQALTR